MAPKKKVEPDVIQLKRLKEETIQVAIRGLSPLIPHRWSEKVIKMMPGHPDKGLVPLRGPRQPEEEAEACLYRLKDGGIGMPATAFKAAIVSACRFFDKPSMTEAKLLFYVVGDEGIDGRPLVRVKGNKQLREDTPRNANGGADLRYRYQIWPWSANLRVTFISSSISKESVVALIDAAGRVGVGDWRPSSPKSHTGTLGMWTAAE